MDSDPALVLRDARLDDVPAIRRFGEANIPPHYTPLIGARAADSQVRQWWSDDHLGHAVAAGLVILAESGGEVVGVAQRGRAGAAHVVYKLYVHPEHRGQGLGRQLLDAVIARLPPDVDRLWIEHVAANTRAGAFYEREGYAVDRVDAHPSGDPGLATVWRSRALSVVGAGADSQA
jgi:GNAT superfamily N-acetyltransferase